MAVIIRVRYSTPTYGPLIIFFFPFLYFFSYARPPPPSRLLHVCRRNSWIIESREARIKKSPRRPAEISRITETTTLFAGWIKNEDETEGPAGSPRLASEEKRGHQSAHHLNVATTEWFKTPTPPRERFAELHRLRLIEFFQSLFLERPSLNCLPAWRTLNGGILKGSWKN